MTTPTHQHDYRPTHPRPTRGATLRREQDEMYRRLSDVADDYIDGRKTRGEYDAARAALNDEIDAIDEAYRLARLCVHQTQAERDAAVARASVRVNAALSAWREVSGYEDECECSPADAAGVGAGVCRVCRAELETNEMPFSQQGAKP